MTEREKMLRGELYNPADPELSALHQRALDLAEAFNRTPPKKSKKREAILKKLFPQAGKGLHMEADVHADYGIHTVMGEYCYFNFNAVILDVCPIRIGDRLMAGPGVMLVAPVHPMVASERKCQLYPDGFHDLEYGKPIEIGDDVWLSSGVIVCGGAKIGDGAVIGAGAVVVGEIPPHTFAAGVPAKAIRPITDEDRLMR